MFCSDSRLSRLTMRIFLCVLAMGLTGCKVPNIRLIPSLGVSSIPVYPFGQAPKVLETLKEKYSSTSFRDELDQCTDDECRKKARNLILEELMLLIDHAHHNYEGSLIAGRAKAKFGFGTATQALSLAATTSTVETTKTIFSGISTLVAATETEVDKNFYLEQTSYALAYQMQAQRLTVSTEILSKMRRNQDYSEYSLERALIDIEAYYRAGTIATAVLNVYQGASEKIKTAQTKREDEDI